jgi:hypothetical protein
VPGLTPAVRAGVREEGMGMGDADSGARSGAGPDREERPSLVAQKVCLSAIAVAVVAAVFVPMLIWAAGILLAGSR